MAAQPSESEQPNVPTTRREVIRRGALASLGIGASLLAGCSSIRQATRNVTGPAPAEFAPLPNDAGAVTSATHVLNRVAYGPRPGDVARVAEIGPAAYIEEQLADRMDEDPAVRWRVDGLDVQQTERSSKVFGVTFRDDPESLYDMADEQLLNETQQAAILRAVYSRHQLRETLADFWTNHFNIYAIKADGRVLIPTDTEKVLRPHLLGRFHDMLLASARSPAMLTYLDAQLNRRGVANENYARELLELHTLGVRSGYTQKDIQEVARCFTGWTVTGGWRRGQFVYDDARHDDGRKYIPFLNLTIAPGGGERDAERVLEQLAQNPTTARFISRKLCRRFLGHALEPIVQKAANAYLASGSDIRKTLRPILLDGLASSEYSRPILKRPLEMVVSSLRALAADTNGGPPLQQHLTAMGQPLYQWPMPDGFPEKASAWTGSMLPRWNFALALASNAIPGTQVDLAAPLHAAAHDDGRILDTLIETITGRQHDAPDVQPMREQIGRHMARARHDSLPESTIVAETTALILASPVFQWR